MSLLAAFTTKLANRKYYSEDKCRRKWGHHISYKGFVGCPNKYNIYHRCSKYCIKRWKFDVAEPSIEYLQRRKRMLKKYPLPNNWTEIYDRGCGRFYYWDTDSDLVSWLPPDHPKAHISYSAAYLRRELISRKPLQTERCEIKNQQNQSTGLDTEVQVKMVEDKSESPNSDNTIKMLIGPSPAPDKMLVSNTTAEQHAIS